MILPVSKTILSDAALGWVVGPNLEHRLLAAICVLPLMAAAGNRLSWFAASEHGGTAGQPQAVAGGPRRPPARINREVVRAAARVRPGVLPRTWRVQQVGRWSVS